MDGTAERIQPRSPQLLALVRRPFIVADDVRAGVSAGRASHRFQASLSGRRFSFVFCFVFGCGGSFSSTLLLNVDRCGWAAETAFGDCIYGA